MLIRRFAPWVLGSTIGLAGSIALSGPARAAELTPSILTPIVPADAIAAIKATPANPKTDRPEGASPAKPSDRPIVIPAVSRLLPASTAALLLMNPDPQRWQSLTQFKAFPRDMTTPGWLFSGAFKGLSYHGDIAPWLGGPVGAAMLLESDLKTAHTATLFPVQDATQMPKFLDRVKRSRGKLPVMRTHNGVNILYWEPTKYPAFPELELDPETANPDASPDLNPDVNPDVKPEAKPTANLDVKPGVAPVQPDAQPDVNPEAKPDVKPKPAPKMREYGGYAIAYLPSGYAVASDKLNTVEHLIELQTSPDKLADRPAFQRMLQDDRYPTSLISGYGDYVSLLQATVANQPTDAVPFPFASDSPEFQSGLKLMQAFQDRIDGFVWIQPEGLQMQASMHLKQPLPIMATDLFKSPNALPLRMPAVTYGMSDGSDLASFWMLLTKGADLVPKLKKDLANFRTFSQKTFGLDDRDIFPWMDQEYAGFAFPSRGGVFPKFEPKLELGLGALIQTTQPKAATTALKKIETAMIKLSSGQMKIQPRVVNGQRLTSWEMPGFKDKNPVSVLAYQWAAPDTLVLLSGADASLNLLPTPRSSLDQSANFKAAIAPLPQENMGYSYFNPPAMLSLANRFGFASWFKTPEAQQDPEMDVATIVNSIFSVAGTSAIQRTQVSSDGFAKLATRPQPKLTAQEFLERAQLKLGSDNDWAIANFTRSLELDANQADAYYGRASAKQSGQDFRGAIADFDRTLELEPQKVDALRFRAEAKREIYDYAGTIADATRGLELKPEPDSQSSLYRERAMALIAQGRYTDALKDLDQAGQTEDSGTQIPNLKCAASARSASADALKVCDQAIESYLSTVTPEGPIDPNIDTARFVPAPLSAYRCLARVQKKEAKAFQDCGNAINSEPDNPLVHELQGQARLASGDRKGAVLSLEKALKLYQLLDDPTAIDRTQALLKQAL